MAWIEPNFNYRNPKTRGAMKHLLLELVKAGSIKNINLENGNKMTATDQVEYYMYRFDCGIILNISHLAEYLRSIGAIKDHNYAQVIQYARYYGEN